MNSLYRRAKKIYLSASENLSIRSYISNGKKPWSRGYEPFKARYISDAIHDEKTLSFFAKGDNLPDFYGQFLDERVVEYPWLLSRKFSKPATVLDAGSITNHKYILEHPFFEGIDLTILTVAPESECFFHRGISYVYSDIRNLPFKVEWFDIIICISTLEHIGMNNEIYTSDKAFHESSTEDYLIAVRELRRVLKPNGRCLISVPFGRYQNDIFQQQFNLEMVEKIKQEFSPSQLTEEFYIYRSDGWQVSTLEECQDCEYFNVHKTKYFDKNSTLDYDEDLAAAARSIILLELFK